MSHNEKDTREKIIAAALKLFSKKSYKIVSLAMIAREVNIQKPSIYHHFTSKEDLFIEAVSKITDEFYYRLKIVAEKQISAKDKIAEIFNLHIRFIDSKKNMIKLFNGAMPDNNEKILNHFINFKKKLDSIMNQIMQEVINERADENNLKPEVMADLFLGMMKLLGEKKHVCSNLNNQKDEMLRHVNILLFNKQ